MERLMLEDMIKALKCISSQDAEGDCYADHENFMYVADDEHKSIVCGTGEDLRDHVSGKKAVGCPYHQNTYGCCFEDGELYWLKDVAELLEELKSYKDLEERLHKIFGEESTFSLADVIDALEMELSEPDKKHPVNARILTYEEANKWQEYKNLEEQGLLVRLPCKVGDTVYRVNVGAKQPIIPMTVSEIHFLCYKNERAVRFDAIGKEDMGESCYRLEDIGRIVFLTREEAKKKLEEMK